MREDGETDTARKVREAVAAGMEGFLDPGAGEERSGSTGEGTSYEEAFAAALGRAVERYLDSLEGDERVRILLGLHRPGVPIPEERMLPEDPEARKRTLQAAADLSASGELRRVRSRKDGRIFWVRVAE